jgi:hypothetical protein
MWRAFAIGLAVIAALFVVFPAAAETGAAGDSVAPFAYVTVVGAPGDGDQALTSALNNELTARGLKLASSFQANVYEVQGTVRMQPVSKSKQSVTIIWVVLGPDGTQRGITRQTRTIHKGSLDRKWGRAATAAAAAAAEDIDKLIPR